MRPHVIDRAGSPGTDLAGQRGAPLTRALHSGAVVRNELAWDACDLGLILKCKARPFARVRAASAAALAQSRVRRCRRSRVLRHRRVLARQRQDDGTSFGYNTCWPPTF